jgi:small subunit ribosomal protein S18
MEEKIEQTKVQNKAPETAKARPARSYPPSRSPQDRDSRKRTFKPRGNRFLFKKKVCFFCKNKDAVIDYKDVGLLKRFISESGKITPRRFTGACTKHQRKIAVEIKKARQMGLLQYTDKHKK